MLNTGIALYFRSKGKSASVPTESKTELMKKLNQKNFDLK